MKIARIVLWSLVACLLCLTFACTSAGGLTRLDEMSPEEFVRYQARVELQVEAVATTMLAEGDLKPSTAELMAAALDGLAAGTVAPGAGGLAAELGAHGYAALAVQLAIVELDAKLEERGAYDPGGWELASKVLASASAGIRKASAAH